MKDFLKLVPYIREKIEGEWLILLIDFKYKEIEEVIQMNIPEYANITFYTSQDIKENLSLKYPHLIEKDKTKREHYMEYMATVNSNFTNKAVNEIYARNSGNLAEIKLTIEKVIKVAGDVDLIDVKHVDKVIEKEDRVFTRDVILAYLLHNNKLVPKKGSSLSKYWYVNRHELKDKYREFVTEEVAFYACRKFLKLLYDERVKSLNGKDYKEAEIVDIIDYYELCHAWSTFKLSVPSQFEACLMNIERRRENDSIINSAILGIDT